MGIYNIEARHEVQITYRVEAASFEEALERLCNKDLFRDQGRNTFGPGDYVMEREGIEVVDHECCGDPSATGREWTERSWVYSEEGGEE